MGRVLIVSLSELTLDARIRRHVDFLRDRYEVVAAAPGRPLRAPGVDFVELRPNPLGTAARRAQASARVGLRLARRYERAYWLDGRVRRWADDLRAVGLVDAIVVNDLWALPLAFAVGEGTPVVFDAHEHWTSESASWTRRQRLSMSGAHEWIVDRHVPATAGMMTVSAGIARDFAARCHVKPALVTNAPFFHDLSPSPVGRPIRLVHIGLADPRRRLEDTIDAVRSLDDRFELDLVLARDNEYRRRLVGLAATDDRVRILPPVPTPELVAFANSYDVGLFLLPARFPNQVHVLPNKLFDYIQARLAVAIGPSPEMAAVVHHWECGVVADSFAKEDFTAALARLTVDEIERMKANAHRAAAELTAENNRETFMSVIERAIATRSARAAG